MASIHVGELTQVEPTARAFMEVHPQDDGTDDDNLATSILSENPKLSSKSTTFASSNNQTKLDEGWTIREVVNGREELYCKGKCVYWTRNSIIVKSFNFTEQVVKVFWTKFGKKDHICIALTSGLSIFRIGQHFQIPLPFAYQNIYATKSGIIIERNCDPLDDSTLPPLFALTHPAQEISPILFKPSGKTTRTVSNSIPDSMSIVACHHELPLCLMYNSEDKQHSLWKIRKTTDEELDEIQRANEESITNTTFNTCPSNSFREGQSTSLSMSSKQKSSLLHQSQPNSTGNFNFSPKMDLRSKHSAFSNLAASRLGVGGGHMTPEPSSTNARSFNSTQFSTPNRNRMINYLRDNIEEPILPQLTLEEVWKEQSNNSAKADKFFTTCDLVGHNYIVVVVSSSNQIKVLSYKISSDKLGNLDLVIERATYVTAIDAMPVLTMKMMIVVDSNKYLALYSGCDRISHITIPQLIATVTTSTGRNTSILTPASTKHSSTINLEVTPIQSSSAKKRSSLADRSSIGSDTSIQQMFEALSPVPHALKHDQKTSTPMATSDIKSIEHVVGKTIYLLNNSNLRFKFDIPTVCQTSCVQRLLNAMRSLVTKDFGLGMLTKWYQTRRSLSQPDLLTQQAEMRLFKNWFLNLIDMGENFFDHFDENKSGKISLDTLLQRPSYHSPQKKSRKARDGISNPFTHKVRALFYALHLVFEDLLLNKLNYDIAGDLVELLMVLACLLRLNEYQDYYWIKFPHLQEKFGPLKGQLEHVIAKPDSLQHYSFFKTNPSSVIGFINKIVMKEQQGEDVSCDGTVETIPVIEGVTSDTHTIISLFCEMYNIDRDKIIIPLNRNISLGPANNDNLKSLAPFRSKAGDEAVVRLMAKLGKTRNYLSSLPEGIELYLWDAILNCREMPPPDWTESCYELIGRTDLVSLIRGTAQATTSIKPPTETASSLNNNSNAGHEDEVLKLIFPDDIRVSEANRMLASDTPVEFGVTQRQGATEEESRDETHRHLYLLNVRTMAMPVGRGAICLRTYSPVIGESFEVPRLELSGRALSEDRPIEYTHDISVYPWPFFHNGVAAGLTICASTANNIIDSTWINYNRPRSNIPHGTDMRDRDLTAVNVNNEHAGFLFALGLNGHLEKLSIMALHDYLCQNNDLTKLAILLGMSAAKRGSRDNNIIKVLSIHVDALLPPNSTELDVPAPVHSASIIGVGLLYQASGDSHISKVLLEEIGRLPGPETNSHVDRESYSLSAGLAFGLVNLCKGGSSTITSSDQLRLYMLGGQRKLLTLAQKERYFKQDCHRGEEEYINTHITSPGGTLGLGLMYHRSSNQSVADWMRAPDTQTLLEYVRPDFLILRMLSYGLIMWNEIEPTEDWINSHIPKIVSAHAFQRNSSTTNNSSNHQLVAANVPNNLDTDYELISQAYCNIVAGCCMSIAMRFAGTANRQAYDTIYKHTKMLIALNNKPALAEQAGRPCLEACLNVLVTSMAVVMAGTGDLGVMRVCRYLRSRLTQSCVFYGSYMAIHMALGILFLGSCRYSLSTSPASIGALVCALYPIYPNHSSDNRYHLQALRHLYVLAAEPRLLIPRDILTNKPVYVKITVRKRQSQSAKGNSGEIELKMRAPCMIPEVESTESVCVDDERYWRIEINSKEALMKCLFKEQGCLSVKQKVHSSGNRLVQDIDTYIIGKMPQGTMRSRKAAALDECVKEDRVEQFSALNQLLAVGGAPGDHPQRTLSLVLEQIRLASALDSNNRDRESGGILVNKLNLLRSVVSEFGDQFARDQIYEQWCDYLSGVKNWTNSDRCVAHFVTLNDLHWPNMEPDIVQTLQEMSFC